MLATRYRIMEYKAETHRHKYVLDILIDKLGEEAALQELIRIGMVHCNYSFYLLDGTTAVFKRIEGKTLLRPRKEVRIIGKEKGKPLLACVSVQGAVKEIKGDELLIDLRELTSATRAQEQVFNYPLVITPDAINLTRRMLEPLHKFHRLAADMMLPPGYVDNNYGFGI